MMRLLNDVMSLNDFNKWTLLHFGSEAIVSSSSSLTPLVTPTANTVTCTARWLINRLHWKEGKYTVS